MKKKLSGLNPSYVASAIIITKKEIETSKHNTNNANRIE